jgi:precorrin-2 dehydrogenase/sirohydrochlorin ferrochelatase
MRVDRVWPYYPVNLDLSGRLCIVFGGGQSAYRKAKALDAHGAQLVVIAPQPSDEIVQLVQSNRRSLLRTRDYVRGDLGGAFLVVAATGAEEFDRAIHAEADEVRCLIHVVGQPDLCSFLIPSVVDRGDLQISISTGGLAPIVSRRARRIIRTEFGEEWAEYTTLMSQVRGILLDRYPVPAATDSMERMADSDLLDRLKGGESPTPEELVEEFAPEPEEEAEEESEGEGAEGEAEGEGAPAEGEAAASESDTEAAKE